MRTASRRFAATCSGSAPMVWSDSGARSRPNSGGSSARRRSGDRARKTQTALIGLKRWGRATSCCPASEKVDSDPCFSDSDPSFQGGLRPFPNKRRNLFCFKRVLISMARARTALIGVLDICRCIAARPRLRAKRDYPCLINPSGKILKHQCPFITLVVSI